MLLAEVAEVSRAVAGSSGRLAKIAAIAAALRDAGPGEVPIVVAYLSGELPQRQIGVGWAALRSAPPASAAPSLTVLGVDASFSEIGAVVGPGSVAERKRLVDEVLGAATAEEQYFLVRLLSGELRQGALDGVMTEAVARASEVPVGAGAARGDAARVAAGRGRGRAGRRRGRAGGIRSAGRPAAQADAGVERAVGRGGAGQDRGRRGQGRWQGGRGQGRGEADEVGEPASRRTPAAVEWKLDGIRIQAHVSGGNVRLFTRTLDDITARLPEVVAALAALPVRTAVFDGELIALRPDGRPYAFQDTAARAASQTGERRRRRRATAIRCRCRRSCSTCCTWTGPTSSTCPTRERRAALAGVVPAEMLMPRLVTADAEEADAFFRDAVARGHEGVVVKSLATPYAAGRRGAGWIKVKPRHTLDLVVLAVEWGHGRRKGWLSNLHLGARDPETGGWVMLGKTFKGLTDELLTWQTARLLELEDHRDDWTVYVRPELVVEIAFDGVQRSPRYPGGVALRFARVLRYREDKPAAEADTIASVRDLAAE